MATNYYKYELETLQELFKDFSPPSSPLQTIQSSIINQRSGNNLDHSGYYPNIQKSQPNLESKIFENEIQKFNSFRGRFINNRKTQINQLIKEIRKGIISFGDKGYCSRGITNATYYLFETLRKDINSKEPFKPIKKFTGGGVIDGIYGLGVGKNVNANNKPMHDSYLGNELGYTKHIIAKHLPRKDVGNVLNQLSWEDGDICVYWSNNPQSGSDSKYKYGHIQMYHLQDIKTPQWFSDFNHSKFVYSSGEDWEIIAFKAPTI